MLHPGSVPTLHASLAQTNGESPWREVSEVEFVELWSRARTACEERWRAGGKEAYERSEWFGRWVPLGIDHPEE